VLLLSLPFGSLTRPSLALGLLAAHCRRLEIECDVRYLTFPFAELIGPDEYLWLTSQIPYEAFAGDWVFTEALYGPRPEADDAYVDEVLRGTWRLRPDVVARIRRVRLAVEPFLAHCFETIDWSHYSFIGFTSMFQQNIASLALAAHVKATYPQLTIAFGGANWEDPMGLALRRRFPFVDLVFSGEADVSFPATLEARRHDRDAPVVPAAAVAELDELPAPDFDPFFEQFRSRPSLSALTPQLLIETARGCWWGERSHCTFCGLNGSTMAFRSKSPERVLEEIAYLRARHGVRRFWVVDDILDMRYFRTVLPMLEAARLDAELFWEVKANLAAKHVRALRAAGVRSIQPGIESLSDRVLASMQKGTTGLKNIELLKWCREYGVKPVWNLLYGFPGETDADYEETRSLIESIWHLDPPQACGRVRLDRFSPYHGDPQAFGMENVRPKAPLSHLYPFPREEVMQIAYYFDFDYADGRRANAHAGRALGLVRAWMADPDRGQLALATHEDGTVHLADSRSRAGAAAERITLDGWRAAVFLTCDSAQGSRELMQVPAVRFESIPEGELRAFLADCVRRRLMVHNKRSWLNVAVHVPAREAARGPTQLTAPAAAV
jgi:ribosomal peptide maturation radical SAM protein 1